MKHPVRKRVDPNPGPWCLSFAWVERGGDFAWPDRGTDGFGKLAAYFAHLSELELEDVLATRRRNNTEAVKPVPGEEVHPSLDSILNRRAGDAEADLLLYEFTYCLGYRDPRRVFAIYNAWERIMYPIGWDPEHKGIGHDPRQSAVQADCSLDCWHM